MIVLWQIQKVQYLQDSFSHIYYENYWNAESPNQSPAWNHIYVFNALLCTIATLLWVSVSNQILRKHNIMVPFLSFSLRIIQTYEKHLAVIISFSVQLRKSTLFWWSLLLSLPRWHQIQSNAKCWPYSLKSWMEWAMTPSYLLLTLTHCGNYSLLVTVTERDQG